MNTTKAMTNREMAAVLFNMATLLKANPNSNLYRIAAYERAGRAMMGLRREAREILGDKEQIAFRRRQHIGKKLHAKIGEMAQTGDLSQFGEFLSEAPPHVAEIVRNVPGVGPMFAERAHAILGVNSKEDMIWAARDGRLRRVQGFGATRTAQIASMQLPGDAVQLALAI